MAPGPGMPRRQLRGRSPPEKPFLIAAQYQDEAQQPRGQQEGGEDHDNSPRRWLSFG